MKTICLFFLVLFLPTFGFGAETITFSAGAALDAFQPSIAAPLLREAFTRSGYVLKVIHLPSARSLQASNAGLTDGELHRVANLAEVTRGRFPNLVRINTPLLNLRTFVFTRAGTPRVDDWENLDGHTIAYKTGRRHIRDSLGKLSAKTTVFPVTSDEQAFEMLARNRVEYVITEREDGDAILAARPDFRDIRPTTLLQVTTVHAYMNKRYKNLAVRISQILAQMKMDGTFKAIVNKATAAYYARQRSREERSAPFAKRQTP